MEKTIDWISNLIEISEKLYFQMKEKWIRIVLVKLWNWISKSSKDWWWQQLCKKFLEFSLFYSIEWTLNGFVQWFNSKHTFLTMLTIWQPIHQIIFFFFSIKFLKIYKYSIRFDRFFSLYGLQSFFFQTGNRKPY